MKFRSLYVGILELQAFSNVRGISFENSANLLILGRLAQLLQVIYLQVLSV